MPEKRLGLEIRKDGVSAVAVKRGLSSSHVAACVNVPTGKDMGLSDALAEALVLVAARTDLSGVSVSAGFSDSPVNFRNISLPFSEIKKVRQILAVELETQVPLRAEDMVADIHVLERDDGIRGIAAYLACESVAFELNLLAAQELTVDHLGSAPFAAALGLFQSADDLPAHGIFLWASPDGAVMICFADGRPVYARRVEGPQVQDVKRLSAQVSITVRAVAETVLPGFSPAGIFVTGTALSRDDFARELADGTGLKISPVDLLAETGIAVSSDEAEDYEACVMDPALALALFPPTETSGINLRQGPFAITHQWERYRGELAHVGILLLCLFLVVSFNFLAQTRLLSREARRIAFGNATLAAAVLEGEPPGDDPVKTLENRVSALQKSQSLPSEEVQTARVLNVLKTVSERIAADTDLRLSQLTMSGEGVQMSGEADSISSVDTVQSRLEKTPPFDKVTIVSTDIDKRTGRVNFRLRCQFPSTKENGQGASRPEGEA